MAFQIPGFSYTREAGADLSAGQHRFVVVAADGQVDLVGSAGANADGVLQNKPAAAGEEAQIVANGISKVVCGGTVTRGDAVQSDASGDATTASTGDYVLGRALETGADGDTIAVLINCPGGQNN